MSSKRKTKQINVTTDMKLPDESFQVMDEQTGDNISEISNTGSVYKKLIGHYLVLPDRRNGSGDQDDIPRMLPCRISNRLRKILFYPTADPNSIRPHVVKVKQVEHVDPLAIGDRVRYLDARDGTGLIVEALPRRNRLARQTAVPMPTAHPFEQVLVANVDQVVPVFSAAMPAPKWNMLDRYLAAIASCELDALICLNKLDLVKGADGTIAAEIQEAVDEYRRIGYRVLLTSAVSGEGLDELKAAFQGRVSVLMGKSGVGKTSLLNALQPGLGLRVAEISRATGKGRHTTSHLEMFPLDGGDGTSLGAIVDTPGVREFGLWDVAGTDLALFFRELRPFVGQCKFGLDCRHVDEPGCAIRQAVSAGRISQRRYQSFLRMLEE